MAAMLLPTSVGKVARNEPEVEKSSLNPAASMLQHAVEGRKLKEATEEEVTEEEKEDEEERRSCHGTCGKICNSFAPGNGATCAGPAAARATVHVMEAIQTIAGETKGIVHATEAIETDAGVTKEPDTDEPMAQLKACLSDAISWPLLFVGIGLLLAGQFDGWERCLDGTELQDRLPEGSLRKLLTVIGLLAFAEGSTLFDARAFALSFACGLTFLALPCLVLYTRRGV